jgi:sterol desaturase/sphingolipid hydroxylase (fatty acid hydroxylase superfamily)
VSASGLSEGSIRLIAFAVIFIAMAVAETVLPRLDRPELSGGRRWKRWAANFSLLFASSLVVRLVFPMAAVGVAVLARDHGFGLLPALGLSPLWQGIVAFILLDFAVWAEHVASHKIPLFWRIHRVHHSDQGIDATTALRFHPLEILLSMLWKGAIVALLGVPPLAVLIFETVLNGAAMFNHANFRLPCKIDRWLRLIIVTPDMHRTHHSTDRRETDSNYGFNLSLWDRLFSTYVAAPARGETGIEIGLDDYRGTEPTRLGWLFLLPFRR